MEKKVFSSPIHIESIDSIWMNAIILYYLIFYDDHYHYITYVYAYTLADGSVFFVVVVVEKITYEWMQSNIVVVVWIMAIFDILSDFGYS